MNYSEFVKIREGLRVVGKAHGSRIKATKETEKYISLLEDFFDEYVSNMNVLALAGIVKETLTQICQEPFVIAKGAETNKVFLSMIDETSPIDEVCEKMKVPMAGIKDETKHPISFVKRTAKVSSVYVEPKDKSQDPVTLGLLFTEKPELSTLKNTETSFKYVLSEIEYEYGQEASGAIANKIFKDVEKQFNTQWVKGME